MRIAYVGDPSSEHLARWVREFRGRGHDCRLFAPAGSCDARIAFEAIGREGATGMRGFAERILDLRRQVKRFSPDVVHGHYALNYGTWAVLAGSSPSIVTCLGSDLLRLADVSGLDRLKVRYALRRADLITVNSEVLREAAVSLGASSSGIAKVVLGVDVADFSSRPQHGDRPTLQLLSARRLEPLYRVCDILEAMSVLRTRDDVRLVITGAGSERQQLEARAHALQVADTVEFAGYVDRHTLVELLQSSEVFVSVPESDSSAVALLEAMAAGAAVIATDLPATREWVDPAVGNILVPVGDPGAIADAVARLAEDRPRCREAGAANRARILADADWTTEMDRMETLYRSLGGTSS